jgi:(p)ppGpp synthase/HD superfamily hydrolase
MPAEPTVPTFMADLPLARRALAYAQDLHAGQERDSDHAPFIMHPLEVAALLYNTGNNETVVAAGILHDTLEDTEAEPADIAERFGEDVARLVRAMTEDPDIEPYEARKAALREQIAGVGPEASAVYAADKVAKVRELRAQLGRDPGLLEAEDDGARRRLGHYEHSLDMLELVTPDLPLVRQLRFELEAIRAMPPGSGG